MTFPADDEEVLDTETTPSRSRKLRVELGVAAVVLGGAVIVARLLSNGSASPKAEPSPSPTPSATTYGTGAPDSGSGLLDGMATISVGNGIVEMTPRLPAPTGADPTQCPAKIYCYTTEAVAAPVLAALRAAFPGAVTESATTVRLDQAPYGQALRFLQINARTGSTQILVRVQAPSAEDVAGSGVDPDGRGSIVHVSQVLQQYFVQVQADDPSRHLQDLTPLRRLATDVRLLADD